MKIFRKKVNAKIINIGFRPRKINEIGTFDRATQTASAAPHTAKPTKSFTRKSSMINMSVAIIFVLGSSLWRIESAE